MLLSCLFLSEIDGTTGDICPVGHYCPTGSPSPTPCSSSTYMNHTGAAACYTCPQGYFCTSGSTADPCPQGYYCPVGTGTDKKPCPVGEYDGHVWVEGTFCASYSVN